MGLKIIDGTPSSISKYIRESENPEETKYKRYLEGKIVANEFDTILNFSDFLRGSSKA